MSEKKRKSRKEELHDELLVIKEREMKSRLDEMAELEESVEARIRVRHAYTHDNIMVGDFVIKLLMALCIAGGFFYTVYTGVNDESMGIVSKTTVKSNVHFQMISVLGPLFGAIIQYYFGKNKAGANGE